MARFVYGPNGEASDYVVRGGITFRTLADRHGTPRLIINDASGELAARLELDEWGNIAIDSIPGWQPFGFGGGVFDAATGLTRLGARDFDPRVGRWVSKDPDVFADTNRYVPAGDDFVNFVDPTGLSEKHPPMPAPVATPTPAPWQPPATQPVGEACSADDDEKTPDNCGQRFNQDIADCDDLWGSTGKWPDAHGLRLCYECAAERLMQCRKGGAWVSNWFPGPACTVYRLYEPWRE